MENDSIKQLKLGAFVVTGIVLLLAAMYFIGRNQQLFGRSIRLVACFQNVNGLQPGNNVRFAGSDAGTVELVEVINDTSVQVVILLQERFASFIRQDALAGIGTDGLMGNKLINIINTPGSSAPCVVNGSSILTRRPVETDEMLRTLDQTNRYVEGIAYNLKNVTDQISGSRGTLWKLLTDTSLADRAGMIVINLNKSAHHIAVFSAELEAALTKVRAGGGLLGTLLADTLVAHRLHRVASDLQVAGEQSVAATADMQRFTNDIDKGKGTLGLLLRDSATAADLRTSVSSLKQSTKSLNRTLDAIQQIPMLKKYIDQDRSQKK